MPKKSKREKQEPNIVVFLVEGESDRIALELPLSDLIDRSHPEYQVRFLLRECRLSRQGEEVDDNDEGEDGDESEEDYGDDYEIKYGGDITTSTFVRPSNIEVKITGRFIMPAVRKEGIYPKRIAKIIHIVDLDGAYIPDENILPYAPERANRDSPFYDASRAVIETSDVAGIIDRNERKRRNLDYLQSLSEIKIRTKKIPYEIYFFSSNMDHFIHHDANVGSGKKKLADTFMRTLGLDTEAFTDFFLKDEGAVGHMGYEESWAFAREGTHSIGRFTNLDCLIRKLTEA